VNTLNNIARATYTPPAAKVARLSLARNSKKNIEETFIFDFGNNGNELIALRTREVNNGEVIATATKVKFESEANLAAQQAALVEVRLRMAEKEKREALKNSRLAQLRRRSEVQKLGVLSDKEMDAMFSMYDD